MVAAVPADALERFHDFFVAGAGVAGALIGLLFVAISVAPHRVTGEGAETAHRIRAFASLTSFTNALSLSLFALIPTIHPGWPAISIGISGLAFVFGALLLVLRQRRTENVALRDIGFVIGMLVLFGWEVYAGVRLIGDEESDGAITTLAILTIVSFLAGISRAWELIGAKEIGLIHEVREAVHRSREAHSSDD